NRDSAVVEQSTENGLVDLYGFDLVHVHLAGLAPDQPALLDYPATGNSNLGGELLEPRSAQREQAQRYQSPPGYRDNWSKVSFNSGEQGDGSDKKHEQTPEINDPVHSTGRQHGLFRLQYAVDV